MKIKITIDSTADCSKEFFEENDLGCFPLIVNMGGEEYLDMEQIDVRTIEDYIKRTKKLPKSAARSSEDFKEFFNNYLTNGYDAVIHISISSQLSCVYNNAVLAGKELGEDKVFVIDSRVLSTGGLLLALSAKDLASAGKPASEIAEIIKARSYAGQTSFVVDKVDNLYKGGRCSMMEMFGANLLNIKPKLQLVDGKIISTGKYRGKQIVVLKKYIDETLALYNNPDRRRCFVTHTMLDDRATVEEIVEYVKSKNIFEEVIETQANSVVFTHCGRGTLGILYINDGGMQ